MDYFVFRLERGSDLKQGIIDFCNENKIESGAIVTAVGCVSEVSIRKADGVNQYFEIKDYELVSLTGTISKDGVHLHVALSDVNLKTIGGHLLDGTIVNTTMEIVIMKFDKYTLTRSFDENTGYNELEVLMNE
ncbi:MAG: DNA-binding protein [Erysipelothrix sp.]|nr:DNA-binding protein [Erysipelothrix sp.]